MEYFDSTNEIYVKTLPLHKNEIKVINVNTLSGPADIVLLTSTFINIRLMKKFVNY